MKYSAVIIAAMTAGVSAQDLSIFPPCSLPCITEAITNSTNCQLTDYVCVCNNMAVLTTAATPCVVDKCGISVATGQVLPATKQFCANVTGGSSSSGSSGAAGTTSMTMVSSGSASASSVATTSMTVVESSTASSSAPEVSATCPSMSTVPVVTTTPPSNGTASATMTVSSTPSAVVTAGAAALGSVGAAAMLMFAAFAL